MHLGATRSHGVQECSLVHWGQAQRGKKKKITAFKIWFWLTTLWTEKDFACGNAIVIRCCTSPGLSWEDPILNEFLLLKYQCSPFIFCPTQRLPEPPCAWVCGKGQQGHRALLRDRAEAPGGMATTSITGGLSPPHVPSKVSALVIWPQGKLGGGWEHGRDPAEWTDEGVRERINKYEGYFKVYAGDFSSRRCPRVPPTLIKKIFWCVQTAKPSHPHPPPL